MSDLDLDAIDSAYLNGIARALRKRTDGVTWSDDIRRAGLTAVMEVVIAQRLRDRPEIVGDASTREGEVNGRSVTHTPTVAASSPDPISRLLLNSETGGTRALWDRPDIYNAHTIDIITRKDGIERRYEGDFLKRVARHLGFGPQQTPPQSDVPPTNVRELVASLPPPPRTGGTGR